MKIFIFSFFFKSIRFVEFETGIVVVAVSAMVGIILVIWRLRVLRQQRRNR